MTKTAKMTIWDVQLGLAVHVQAPNEKYIVIDLGTGNEESRNVSPLNRLKNENIAFMVITHPHLDHIDDILKFDINKPKILRRARGLIEKEIMQNVRDCDRQKFEKYCQIDKQYCMPIEESNDNNTQYPENYGGLKIECFDTLNCAHDNFNNFSVITVFSISGIKIVVCGDNEIDSLDFLLKDSNFKSAVKDADVLIAPHHGRESAYHTDFVSLTNPRITVISDTHKSDTSAIDKYTNVSRGWEVHKNGFTEKRYCLTTRKDGNIEIIFGESENPKYSGILSVSCFKN